MGAEGRDGRDFAVVAGDGTVQLPPAVLDRYPAGTLFTVVEDGDDRVVLTAADPRIPSSARIRRRRMRAKLSFRPSLPRVQNSV